MEKAEGKMKEAYGALVGDEAKKAEGRAQQRKAQAEAEAEQGEKTRRADGERDGQEDKGGLLGDVGGTLPKPLRRADASRRGIVVLFSFSKPASGRGDRPKKGSNGCPRVAAGTGPRGRPTRSRAAPRRQAARHRQQGQEGRGARTRTKAPSKRRRAPSRAY
jgi:uncharacterized protein YjbJ (UPF0337 family)